MSAATSTVPADVVRAKMAIFEKAYNDNNPALAAAQYAPACLVTVNGGTDKGGPFTGTAPDQCEAFLDALRNQMGGTNIKFTITSIADNVHTDTWVADNGTGSCRATWAQQDDGEWLMVHDEISFTPKDA